ncbi:hypothetical protein AURDEDRAFT_173112 [Auricularia subglabra TFB-10046 SS5]|nr:hypothetical protein AURDEDRAFT_173112 [Auricularia subglabra TFB-10046 SS5]
MSATYVRVATSDSEEEEDVRTAPFEVDDSDHALRSPAKWRWPLSRTLVVAGLLLLGALGVVSALTTSRTRSVTPPTSASPVSLTPTPTRAASTGRECGRVMVRKIDMLQAGFGSEFNHYLRAKALSAEMNWTVVADTSVWIYGNLNDIFIPPAFDCDLPPDTFSYSPGKWHEFGRKGWENATRLFLSRGRQSQFGLDALARQKSINSSAMDEFLLKTKMWAMDTEHVTLPYGESIVRGTEKSFLEQVSVLEKEWVPNEKMQAQVDRLRERIGLTDIDSRERRPVVVLQIRLGDKKKEWEDPPRVGTHMRQDDLSVYFHAAKLAVARLYDKAFTDKPFPARTRFDPKPLLVIMTAETGLVEKLTELDTNHEFEIVLSPSEELSKDEKAEYDRLYGPSHARRGLAAASGHSSPRTMRRWTQSDFLRASHELRLALTRQLVAELTVYSRYADAFVVTGNSNLGRLAQVIAGAEASLGTPARRAVGGRVRSIDVPFYPTMQFAQLFNDGQSPWH